MYFISRTLHRDKPPLEMGDTYWQYRDTIVNCELFLLRSLQFKAVVYHPHKVRSWGGIEEVGLGLPWSGKNTCIWKMKFFPGQRILWMAREI